MSGTASPLHLYGDGLLGNAREEVSVRSRDGTVRPLALSQYLGAADATDHALLKEISGPVLDVGCGPGRHLHALAGRGVFALGVDLSPVAVALARGRGAQAIVGSIFGELPGSGTWRTALLLDGNIGIGGAPERLLRRLGDLLSPDGEVVAELARPGSRSCELEVRLESAGALSDWFAWAEVAVEDVEAVAARAEFGATQTWRCGGRWFARLSRSPAG